LYAEDLIKGTQLGLKCTLSPYPYLYAPWSYTQANLNNHATPCSDGCGIILLMTIFIKDHFNENFIQVQWINK
jgi:hypothetical protein